MRAACLMSSGARRRHQRFLILISLRSGMSQTHQYAPLQPSTARAVFVRIMKSFTRDQLST